MKHEKALLLLVSLLVIGVWMIVLQNTGLIPPISMHKVNVVNTVDVSGSIDVDNTVDVNLAEVVGHGLVSSERGMYIGVSSTENTIIPINWGEIVISR